MSSFDPATGRPAAPPSPRSVAPTPIPSAQPLEGPGRSALPGELELRNRAYCLTRTQRWAALAALIAPFVALAAAVLLMLMHLQAGSDAPANDELGGELIADLWQGLSNEPFQVVVFALTTGISLLALLRGARERVFVGPTGVRYLSGMPRWLCRFDGSWSVSADQIVEIRAAHSWLGTSWPLVQIVIETSEQTRPLHAFTYVDPDRYDARLFRVLARMKPDPSAVAELFDSLPLVAYARGLGFEPSLPVAPATGLDAGTSARQKPRLALAVLVLLALLGYSAIDMGILSETYASGAPAALIVISGAAFGALGWALLGARESSRRTRAAVSGLLALAGMAALYPGLIRINRIAAPDPIRHIYRHSDASTLEPVQATSPPLDLPELVDRLPGSEPGDLHELWIRRGRLGFDQLDIDALDRWIETLERRGR